MLKVAQAFQVEEGKSSIIECNRFSISHSGTAVNITNIVVYMFLLHCAANCTHSYSFLS
jgi:hypothetical protein